MSALKTRLAEFWRRYHAGVKAGATVGVASVLVILLVIGIKNLQQSQRNGEQIKQELTQLERNSRQQASDIKKLNNHIDCIVNLYSKPNRQNLTIDDIRGCKIIAQPTSTTATPKTNTSTSQRSSQTSGGSGTSTKDTNTPSQKDNDQSANESFLRQLIRRIL